jgi:starch synthase
MNKSPLKVLFVCAEVAPFATIGGLAQVAYFLPRALKKLGVDVSVFMPRYGTIDEKKYKIKPCFTGLTVPTGEVKGVTELVCNVKMREGTKRDPTVYFLENMEYYEKRANVYGYSDDAIRFALLSRGAIEFIKATDMRPTVIHCNDWHTGFLANYLRTIYKGDPTLKNVSTVFTIHNLKNQGIFDFRFASPMDFDDGKSTTASFFAPQFQKQNALKRGIIYSDLVNTVSETYSREIMTPEYGEGLSELLKELRTKVFGVLNGLDHTDFDPVHDRFIKKNYSWRTLSDRIANKRDLQRSFGLTVDPKIPILAYSGRLDDQKGLDLLIDVLPTLLSEYHVQFVVIGTGHAKYRDFFTKLEIQFPGLVGTHLMRDFVLPRRVFAGADMLLLPSKFEPGGIVVIEGMRYGTVPIVRSTGGLADIVTDFDPEHNTGNGFTFHNYNKLSLFGSIIRAIQVYRNEKLWGDLMKRVMKEDVSWEKAACQYIDLYTRAIEFRRDRQNPVTSIGKTIE